MADSGVTVVMITRDRRASTLRTVRILRDLPEQPPVVVVDNGSSDGTVEAISAIADVTVIAAGRNLGAAGRTLGVRVARTPYVAFADDDSWWAPGALATAVKLFTAHAQLGLLTGRTLVGPDEDDDPVNAALGAAPLGTVSGAPGPTVLGFLACAAIVRRSAYLEIGGFHPRFGVGGEEQLLAIDLLSAGWQLCYVPDVLVHHHPTRDASRSGRPVGQRRNDLWTVWLRRPLPAALAAGLSAAGQAPTDAVARAALAAAVRGLPWVVRERRVAPAAVQQMLDRVRPVDRPRS